MTHILDALKHHCMTSLELLEGGRNKKALNSSLSEMLWFLDRLDGIVPGLRSLHMILSDSDETNQTRMAISLLEEMLTNVDSPEEQVEDG